MSWRRLSEIDAVFLYGETERTPLHVMAVLVLESGGGHPGDDCRRLRERIAARLHSLPSLRRRIVEVPLALDLPIWADDPGFDLDAHVHRAALPAGGGDRELAEILERVAETRLHRDRPPWEIHIVEGLARGRLALVAKIHHAAVDGIGGMQLLARLLDASPDPAPPQDRDATLPEESSHPPSPLRLLAHAAASLPASPSRTARRLWRAGELGLRLLGSGASPAPRARRSLLNRRVTSRRRVALGSVPFADVKRVGRAFAATVNHVVLAACAEALRGYLADHGEMPHGPLVAAVPKAWGRRSCGDTGNAISLLRISLPVHLGDALDRLHAAREASREAVRSHELHGDPVAAWTRLLAAPVLAGASHAYGHFGIAGRHPPLHNVVISNVPGPRGALYCAGMRVSTCHPLGPIYDGWALNLTVLSYAGSIGLGALACPEAVPDLEQIPRRFEAAVARLADLARGQEKPLAPARCHPLRAQPR